METATKRKRKPLTIEHRTKIAQSNSCRLKTPKQIESARRTMRRLWSTQREWMIDAQKRGRKRAYQDFLSMQER